MRSLTSLMSFLFVARLSLGDAPICYKGHPEDNCSAAAAISSVTGPLRSIRFVPGSFGVQEDSGRYWVWMLGYGPLPTDPNLEARVEYFFADLPPQPAGTSILTLQDLLCRDLAPLGVSCTHNYLTGVWKSDDRAMPLPGVRFVFQETSLVGGTYALDHTCKKQEGSSAFSVRLQCAGAYTTNSVFEEDARTLTVKLRQTCSETERTLLIGTVTLNACPSVPIETLPFTDADYDIYAGGTLRSDAAILKSLEFHRP